MRKVFFAQIKMAMIRAFFGITIPAQVVSKLEHDMAAQLAAHHPNKFRWIESECWHVTVKFFAQISPEGLSTISQALKQYLRDIQAFHLTIKKIAKFPTRHSNICAAFVKPKPVLRDIHKFLDTKGEEMGVRRESRRYKPHITLAKFKSSEGVILPVKYTAFILPVKDIILYESRPTEKGRDYIPLKHFPLLE